MYTIVDEIKPFTLDDYQKLAARTLVKEARPLTEHETMVLWNTLGVAGEAGELTDYVKKGIFHQHGLDVEVVVKEIGDVLWYLACLCTTMGISLDDVGIANIAKLRRRYPEGFNVEDSKRRVDTHTSRNVIVQYQTGTTSGDTSEIVNEDDVE